jgi:hypothetical protein
MLTGLLLARQKFGPRIDVTGGDDFRERTVMLAVEHRLDIRFGDAALEARRLSLVRLMQQQEELARAVQKARSMPPQRTVSEPRRPERKPEPSPDGPER